MAASVDAGTTSGHVKWELASSVYALAVAAVLAHFLFGIPVQFSDSFGNMVNMQGVTFGHVLHNEFWQKAYLRPFLWAELKLVFDLAGDDYFFWFRGLHALQGLALVLMYVRLVRPRSAVDFACVPLGLAVLIGGHTFRGTVTEAFPINTYLTIVLCCFAAALLALSRYRPWNDLVAGALSVFAALTVESGLLVAVVFVGAALTGARGLSRVGIALQIALAAGYSYLRFVVLEVGAPSLLERSSGFGWTTLDPSQIQERFGANPLPFYLYNIATSAVSVLVSEPRAGVWRLTSAWVAGDPPRWMLVNVIASLLATSLIAGYAWRRRRSWLTRDFTHDDRLVLLFVAVLTANAAISYPYTKDVIMSPAGSFLAAAVFAAARDRLPRLPARKLAYGVWMAALVAGSVTWSLRYLGLHASLRNAGYEIRTEWAYAGEWRGRPSPDPLTPDARRLKERLRDDAVLRRPAPPPLVPVAPWTDVMEID
jgi:hypothetical protein